MKISRGPEKAGLRRDALAPLLSGVEALTAHIREYDPQIEKFGEENYPEVLH